MVDSTGGTLKKEHLFKVLVFSFKLCFVFFFLALTAGLPVVCVKVQWCSPTQFQLHSMEQFPMRRQDTSQGQFSGLKLTAHQRVNSCLLDLAVTLHPPESLLTWNHPENFSIIYLVITNENHPGVSLEGMMLKLKLQYLGHLSWLIGKDFDVRRDWGQEENGTTEDEMAGWHHRVNGCESEWTLGVGDGQGGLVCCDSLGRKESDTTERLDWTELILSPWRSETSSFGLLFSHTGILLFVAVHRIFLCVCRVCIFWSRQLLVDRKAVDVLCVCILQPVTFWFSSSSQLFSWFS